MSLLLFLLATWGFTAIISMGEIFAPLRRWLLAGPGLFWIFLGKLISCPQCLGFWIAGFLALFWPIADLVFLENWARVVVQAGIGSGACLLLSAVLHWLGWE